MAYGFFKLLLSANKQSKEIFKGVQVKEEIFHSPSPTTPKHKGLFEDSTHASPVPNSQTATLHP
jgi:hypothetical protein